MHRANSFPQGLPPSPLVTFSDFAQQVKVFNSNKKKRRKKNSNNNPEISMRPLVIVPNNAMRRDIRSSSSDSSSEDSDDGENGKGSSSSSSNHQKMVSGKKKEGNSTTMIPQRPVTAALIPRGTNGSRLAAMRLKEKLKIQHEEDRKKEEEKVRLDRELAKRKEADAARVAAALDSATQRILLWKKTKLLQQQQKEREEQQEKQQQQQQQQQQQHSHRDNIRKCGVDKPESMFWVSNGNGFALVNEMLVSLGYERVGFSDRSRPVAFRWVEWAVEDDWQAFHTARGNCLSLINAIRGINVLTNKAKLADLLKGSLVIPETCVVTDEISLRAAVMGCLGGGSWIAKAARGSQGSGIWLHLNTVLPQTSNNNNNSSSNSNSDDSDDSGSNCNNNDNNNNNHVQDLAIKAAAENFWPSPCPPAAPKQVVVQRYIENPLLLQGRKFDIRAFVLLASVSPRLVLWWPHVYLRRCPENYNTLAKNARSAHTHITNVCMSKQHPLWLSNRDDFVWDQDKFAKCIGVRASNFIIAKGKALIGQAVAAALDSGELQSTSGCFHLLGCDLLVDDTREVRLLEVNRNPDLELHTRVLADIIPPLIKETIRVAMAVNQQLSNKQSAWPVTPSTRFELLLSEI